MKLLDIPSSAVVKLATDAAQTHATDAASSATAAANSASAAQTAQTAAQAAQAAAEAARDAANTSGRAYTASEGTAAGVADSAVATGQCFAVVAADLQSYSVYRKDSGPVATLMFTQYTKAYLDQIADRSTDRYWKGKLVLFARADSANRGGDVITVDGQHYAKYALRAGSGITLTLDADGFYRFSLGTTDSLGFTNGNTLGGTVQYYYQGKKVTWARSDLNSRGSIVETEDGNVYIPKLASIVAGNGIVVTPGPSGPILSLGSVGSLSFTNGNTIGGTTQYYFQGKKVTWGRVDSASRGSIIETEDGGIYIHKLASPALDSAGSSAPLETNSYVFDVATVSGLQQVFRTSKSSGVRAQATSSGNNSAPRLSADGSKLVYSTDRNGAREGYYQLLAGTKLGGAVEHPVVPRKTLMPLGDSLTAADYASTVAATLGTTLLVASNDATAGIGSQISTQIAARYGALNLTCSLNGNTMVTGANVLTAISNQLISRNQDVAGTVRSLRASILGIAGSLTSTQSTTSVPGSIAYSGTDYYTYTFTPDAGQTLPGSVPAGTALVIDPEARQDSILLVWMGRNNVGQTNWSATVKSDLAAVIAAYKPLVRKIVVIGVTNSTSEPSGSTNYNAILAHNADLATLYPDSFVDVRPAYNAGTADDTPNPSYTSDGTHYTSAGKTVIANVVSNFITSKGWF